MVHDRVSNIRLCLVFCFSFSNNFPLRKYFLKAINIDSLTSFLPSVKIDPNEGFLKSGKYPVLTVLSAGHALHVFVNGQLGGMQYIGLLKGYL